MKPTLEFDGDSMLVPKKNTSWTELEQIFYMGFCDAKNLDAIIADDENQTNQPVIGNIFDIPSSDSDPRTMHSWNKIVGEARIITICNCGFNKVGYR